MNKIAAELKELERRTHVPNSYYTEMSSRIRDNKREVNSILSYSFLKFDARPDKTTWSDYYREFSKRFNTVYHTFRVVSLAKDEKSINSLALANSESDSENALPGGSGSAGTSSGRNKVAKEVSKAIKEFGKLNPSSNNSSDSTTTS